MNEDRTLMGFVIGMLLALALWGILGLAVYGAVQLVSSF